MNTAQIIALAPQTIGKSILRLWIRIKLNHVEYQLIHLYHQRKNDQAAEKFLMKQMAILRSDLRNT